MNIEKGYYWVTFYNHSVRRIMFFNGKAFEGFPSDDFIHDEIESYVRVAEQTKGGGDED